MALDAKDALSVDCVQFVIDGRRVFHSWRLGRFAMGSVIGQMWVLTSKDWDQTH